MDLFSAPQHQNVNHSQEDALQKAMRAQWEKDKAKVADRRIIPDWIGEPRPLSKDRARILELIYEIGCIEWTNNPSEKNAIIARSLKQPVANVKGLLKSMQKEGLIKARIYDKSQTWEMTSSGEYALEDWQLERELGFL
jgi:predicted transcriptional regulator